MPTKDDVPTIGYGHTHNVTMDMHCTPQEAEDWLREDLSDAEHAVTKYVTVPITQNQFDALVSLIFNIGVHAFMKSTLLKCLNVSAFSSAAEQFLVWNKQAHIELKGLTRRRHAEKALFEKK